MENQTKMIARMDDELWQSYALFRDPLERRSDPALLKATINDIYQLYRFMSGMDAVEVAKPPLQADMGEELAQTYDLCCKEALRRAGDPILVLDVMKDLDDMCLRMQPEDFDLGPYYTENSNGARP